MKVDVMKKRFRNSMINASDIILLEAEDLNQCDANSIANTIFETFKKYSLPSDQCLTFLSDNTNYMLGIADVVKFNQISKAKAFQISCTLQIAHIILTNSGKTSTTIGFIKEKYPFNLLYLV